MIKVIIFDYDGVIADSYPRIHQVYKIICKNIHKKCPPKMSDFRKVYGLHSQECCRSLGFNNQDIKEAQ